MASTASILSAEAVDHHSGDAGLPQKTTGQIHGQVSGALASYSREEQRGNNIETSVQEHAEETVGFLVAFMLIGAVLFNTTVMYLVNSTDPQVRSYSYKMLSTGVVVFCALFVQDIQEKVLHRVVHGIAGEHALACSLGVFLAVFSAWFLLISLASWRLRSRPQDQHCVLSLSAHVCAFLALDFLGARQESAALRWVQAGRRGSALGLYLSSPALAWLGLRLCVLVARRFRLWHLEPDSGGAGGAPEALDGGQERGSSCAAPVGGVQGERTGREGREAHEAHEGREAHEAHEAHEGHHGHGDHGEAEHGHAHGHHDWKLEAVHAEADAIAIVVGFLVKQCAAYLVTAHPVPMECSKDPVRCQVGGAPIGLMLVLAVALYLAVLPTALAHQRLERTRTWLIRLEMTLCMSLSWLVLQVSEWVTIDVVLAHAAPDSTMHATTVKKLMCAGLLSPLFVIAILGIDAVADRGIITSTSAETTMQCIAFMIAFFWERVFLSAIRNISHSQPMPLLLQFLVGCVLLGCIVPAWRWFLVPVACEPVPERRANESSLGGMVVTWAASVSPSKKSRAPQARALRAGEEQEEIPADPPTPDPKT